MTHLPIYKYPGQVLRSPQLAPTLGLYTDRVLDPDTSLYPKYRFTPVPTRNTNGGVVDGAQEAPQQPVRLITDSSIHLLRRSAMHLAARYGDAEVTPRPIEFYGPYETPIGF